MQLSKGYKRYYQSQKKAHKKYRFLNFEKIYSKWKNYLTKNRTWYNQYIRQYRIKKKSTDIYIPWVKKTENRKRYWKDYISKNKEWWNEYRKQRRIKQEVS